MVVTALTAFSISTTFFVVFVFLIQQERRRGRRFFAARSRTWADRLVSAIEQGIAGSFNHFMRYMVQLNWYYSVHSLLRTFLRGLVKLYTFFEVIFEKNRKRTKELRAEKRQLSELNHLRQMAAHKVDTALSPAQKHKLRKKTLEGRD